MPDQPPKRRRRRPAASAAAKKRAAPQHVEVMIAAPLAAGAPPRDRGKRVVYVETVELG